MQIDGTGPFISCGQDATVPPVLNAADIATHGKHDLKWIIAHNPFRDITSLKIQ